MKCSDLSSVATLIVAAAIGGSTLPATLLAQKSVRIAASCKAGSSPTDVTVTASVIPSSVHVNPLSDERVHWKLVDNSPPPDPKLTAHILPDPSGNWPYIKDKDNDVDKSSGFDSDMWKNTSAATSPHTSKYAVKVTCVLNGQKVTTEIDPDVTIDPGTGTQGKKPVTQAKAITKKDSIAKPVTKKP